MRQATALSQDCFCLELVSKEGPEERATELPSVLVCMVSMRERVPLKKSAASSHWERRQRTRKFGRREERRDS